MQCPNARAPAELHAESDESERGLLAGGVALGPEAHDRNGGTGVAARAQLSSDLGRLWLTSSMLLPSGSSTKAP